MAREIISGVQPGSEGPDLMALRAVDRAQWPRRAQILFEAARLFAVRGYHGTSTRDIADALGIRQPSLYKHYASKLAILEDLLEYDVARPAARATWLAAHEAAGAPARLYAYILLDVRYCLDAPFDIRGLSDQLLLEEPELEAWARRLRGWYQALRRIIRDGVTTGEFHDLDPEFARQAIWGIEWEIIRNAQGTHGRRTAGKRPDKAATFALRAMLRDPSALAELRPAAMEVVAAWNAAQRVTPGG